MRLETKAHLGAIDLAAARITEALEGVTLDAFLGHWEKQSAVERQFLIIGEALVRIRNLEAFIFDRIDDGVKIVGLRNILAHGYDAVDAESIYRLAGEPILQLRTTVGELMR